MAIIRNVILFFLPLVISTALLNSSSQAANIILKEKTIFFKGSVRIGDNHKLKIVIENAQKKSWYNGSNLILSLNSRGGNFSEAIKIANQVWKSGISTYIAADKICLSACSIIFMAGSSFTPGDGGHYWSNRLLNPRAVLGFHAPFVSKRIIDKLPSNSLILKQGHLNAVRFLELARMMNWSNTLISQLLKVNDPKKFIYVETVDDAGKWKIPIEWKNASKFHENMLGNICLNAFYWKDGSSAINAPNCYPCDNDGISFARDVKNFQKNKKGDNLTYLLPSQESSSCKVDVYGTKPGFGLQVHINNIAINIPSYVYLDPGIKLNSIK